MPLDAWLYEPFYQIVRQRLLADRMVARREHGVEEVKVVVVVPEDNAAYRRQVTSPALAAAFPDADTVAGVARATRTETSRWSASTPSPTRCGPRAAMSSCSGPDINETGTGGKGPPGSRALVPQRRSPCPVPSAALIAAIVEVKRQNPRFGYQRIADQVNLAFDIPVDKHLVRRVLAKNGRPDLGSGGPSWLTFLGHSKDSFWSVDLFRCETLILVTH